MNIKQQRAACVADVGDMASSAGEAPDQERVNGSKEDVSSPCACSQVRIAIEQVLDLGPEK